MKTVIIGGGGTVGSTVAFCLGRRNIVDEIVLIDAKENMAKSHAMDMEQAVAAVSKTKIRAGSWPDLKGAAFIIVTAGLPERQVVSRNDFLQGNREIIRGIAQHIRKICPNTIVLTATNPVDVLNYEMYKELKGSPQKIIGFAQNDSTRLCWAVAKVLGKDARDISGLAIGEHGESIFLFNTICIDGNKVILTPDEKLEAINLVQNWFSNYQKLDSKRSSGWTSGENIANMVEAMVNGSDKIFICSVILNGNYGVHDISIGVPVKLGQNGIEKIIEIPLTSHEAAQLKQAENRLQGML